MEIYTQKKVVIARRMSLDTFVTEILGNEKHVKDDREGWMIEYDNSSISWEPFENIKLLFTPRVTDTTPLNTIIGDVNFNDIKKSESKIGLYEIIHVSGLLPSGNINLSNGYDQIQMLSVENGELKPGIVTEQLLYIIIDRLLNSDVSNSLKDEILKALDIVFKCVRESREETIKDYGGNQL